MAQRFWRPVIVTENPTSGRSYRLHDDRNRQWFSHYSEDGAGFGYLKWTCQRPVGFDWDDIGYGFPVTMRKGPFKILFDGQITKIKESGGMGSQGSIEIWALGWVHTASADIYNYVYAETRVTRWVVTEDVSGSLRPDRFDVRLSGDDGIYAQPRRGIDYGADDYVRARYTFGFSEGAARITGSYDVAFPNSWPGKLEILDSSGSQWSKTATESGTFDVTVSGSYVEVRFYCTAAGESTADDGDVYGKLTDVTVFSENVTTLDGKVIADDIAIYLNGNDHGISNDVTLIQSPGRQLSPAYFDTDMTPAEVLSWCCQFGDSDGDPVVWGVDFDENRRMFLEPVDLTTIKYVVSPIQAQLERSGDWGESAQVVYAVYSDEGGETQRTADSSDSDMIDRLGGYYIRRALKISGTTDADRIAEAVALWLAENAEPKSAGSFKVIGGVSKPTGLFVPYDEIVPGGGLVQVREWRAREATFTGTDYRDNETTFPLAGVKVNEDDMSVELIARGEDSAFGRYMAVIQELIGAQG